MKSSEQKIYGRNACLAIARFSPQSVIRAYCTESNKGRLGALLKVLAQKKRAYHFVTDAELSKICDSEHHEGVCLLVERQLIGSESELTQNLAKLPRNSPHCILCLDGISNPHNFGAIVRTAAHFGIKHVLLTHADEEARRSLLSGAYHRTAEGGAVHVSIYASEEAANLLQKLRKEMGWTVVVTSSHGQTKELHKTQLPQRCVLVMGSEADGVTQSIVNISDLKVCIKGTGHVESLNVASATAILLNEFNRQASTQRKSSSASLEKPTRGARALGKNRRGS